MTKRLIDSYQEIIVKIFIVSLRSFNRLVGREIFISMLKGRKDSKIVKGKYYENEYYGVFSCFRGNEINCVLDYLIENGIIKTEIKGKNTFLYTTKTLEDIEMYRYDFMGYISDGSINMVDKDDEELYSRLKGVRFSLALENDIQPYSICSDKILRDICILKPKNKIEMDRIPGIGFGFIENYANVFLKILEEYI